MVNSQSVSKVDTLAKLHVQIDLEQAVLTVPLRQKNARRKAFSRAENEVAGRGRVKPIAKDGTLSLSVKVSSF